MKISKIHIKNFRAFKDVTMNFDDYTCLVGPNGAGKSTVLAALNVFFREGVGSSVLVEQDFHYRNTSQPVEILVTFSDLSDDAKADFSDYFRGNELTISSFATFNASSETAQVVQYGQRLAMPAFAEFFRALSDGAKVSDLKVLYQDVAKSFQSLPSAGTKDQMFAALRSYEESHQNECVLIPSEDQFYGLSRGANRLAKYVQWVYIPAVKDASSEQIEERNSALGKLLSRTVRAQLSFTDEVSRLRSELRQKYALLLESKQNSLERISNSLQERLSKWAHPAATLKIAWTEDSEKSVRIEEPLARIVAGEGAFSGDLSRFGNGLQRSYLLALLEELAESEDDESPRLILGCEEPELYQHPPQAKHLAHVLRELPSSNAQVIVSSHSPLFVTGAAFDSVRLVRKIESGASNIHCVSARSIGAKVAEVRGKPPFNFDASLAKIHQELQSSMSEMFFTSRLILVEGLEDVAYITTYLQILNLWERFRRAGCHLLPANGKSHLILPLCIATELEIPTFVVFDADAGNDRYRNLHEADNKALLELCGYVDEEPIPNNHLWFPQLVVWSSNLTEVVSTEVPDWNKYKSAAEQHFGFAGDMGKNGIFISHCLFEGAKENQFSASLKMLCESIITFAEMPN